jgi:hypothetical protein
MRKYKLDAIDRQILHDLQADGRMSNVDLAKRVGISAPPCLRRVKTLEEKSDHPRLSRRYRSGHSGLPSGRLCECRS